MRRVSFLALLVVSSLVFAGINIVLAQPPAAPPLSVPTAPQYVSLVKDIQTSSVPVTYTLPRYGSMLVVGDTLYFAGCDGTGRYGCELWKTDGTPAGTVMVKDVYPGPANSSMPNNYVIGPVIVTATGSTLYFVANDGEHGSELWKSDGSAAGTLLVKDILPGTKGAFDYLGDSPLARVLGNTMFFFADDGDHGIELWKSDGTEAGTVLVKDVYTGAGSSSSGFSLAILNGQVYFGASDGAVPGLWKTDGTESGTFLVKQMVSGGYTYTAGTMSVFGNKLYFNGSFVSLWVSDGSTAGTSKISAVNPGLMSAYSGLAYFRGGYPCGGGGDEYELWRTDGTVTGTVLFKDIRSGCSSSQPGNFQVINNLMYFVANDGINGREWWRSDGTDGGTLLFRDIYTGSNGSSPTSVLVYSNTIFFQADDGVHGAELWKTDGTVTGTVLVKDIVPGAVGSSPGYLVPFKGKLFFAAADASGVYGLWQTDGTEAGTTKVSQPVLYAGSNPMAMTIANGGVNFSAYNDASGRELWISDGTGAGTVQIKDIVIGTGGSSPNSLFNYNGTLVFGANDGSDKLWTSDGTFGGTTVLANVRAGGFAVSSGRLFFAGNDGASGNELWQSNGTPGGTSLVKDINPSGNSNPGNLVDVNGTVFFTITSSGGCCTAELWKSDGTEPGTVAVIGGFSGGTTSGPAYPSNLTNVNGTLFFRANAGTYGDELWRSDGTLTGTVLVRDIYTGTGAWPQNASFPNGSIPSGLTNLNGLLIFSAQDGSNGRELWKSDGTYTGTVLVKDICPGVGGSMTAAGSLAVVGNLAYFAATDCLNGMELWQTDGTALGTRMVRDLNPGAADSGVQNLTAVSGTLYFMATDGVRGYEPWRSDGTAEGTYMLGDVAVGPASSYPGDFVIYNGELLFVADDGVLGREVWKATLAPLSSKLYLPVIRR